MRYPRWIAPSVLIVDGNRHGEGAALAEILRDASIEARLATDPQSATDKLREHTPDLVVVDEELSNSMLPIMQRQQPNVPFMLMLSQLPSREMEGTRVMMKPLDLDALLQWIDHIAEGT